MDDVHIPENIAGVLQEGPKYGVETKIAAHEFAAVNRSRAAKVEVEQRERRLLEGADCPYKCGANRNCVKNVIFKYKSYSPLSTAISWVKDRSLP